MIEEDNRDDRERVDRKIPAKQMVKKVMTDQSKKLCSIYIIEKKSQKKRCKRDDEEMIKR